MTLRLISNDDMLKHDDPIPDGFAVVNFKLINIGPTTLSYAEYKGNKICEIVLNQPSFFLVSDSSEDIRKTMHEFVDKFCDAREEKNESKN